MSKRLSATLPSMEDRHAQRIVSEALRLRSEYPQATALEVLDQVFEGNHGADLDLTDSALMHGDHTDPREQFGQLLAAAFDDVMSPAEWRNILAQAFDPEPLLDLWHGTIVGTRFAERYHLWGVEDPAGGPTTDSAVFESAPMNVGPAISSERVRNAHWPF